MGNDTRTETTGEDAGALTGAPEALKDIRQFKFFSFGDDNAATVLGFGVQLDGASTEQLRDELGIPPRQPIKCFGLFYRIEQTTYPEFRGWTIFNYGVPVKKHQGLGPILFFPWPDETSGAYLRVLRSKAVLPNLDAFAEVRWTWKEGRAISRVGWSSTQPPSPEELARAASTIPEIEHINELTPETRGRPVVSKRDARRRLLKAGRLLCDGISTIEGRLGELKDLKPIDFYKSLGAAMGRSPRTARRYLEEYAGWNREQYIATLFRRIPRSEAKK